MVACGECVAGCRLRFDADGVAGVVDHPPGRITQQVQAHNPGPGEQRRPPGCGNRARPRRRAGHGYTQGDGVLVVAKAGGRIQAEACFAVIDDAPEPGMEAGMCRHYAGVVAYLQA